ncbi:MAG: hypothetical protein ACI8PW_000991 [Methylophilaceae bacterium]|jgi:hypothetical protein
MEALFSLRQLILKEHTFLETVLETEADTAMHYVCKQKAYKEAVRVKKAKAAEAVKNKPARLLES